MAMQELTPVRPNVHHSLTSSSGQNVVSFRGRGVSVCAGGPISGSVSFRSDRPSDRPLSTRDKRSEVEKLWQDFFSNPLEWRDYRLSKVNPRFPDFIHKETQEALWLDSKWIAPWVEVKLADIAPGTLETTSTPWNQELPLPKQGRSEVENLWRKFFSDPSEWQDHRLGKVNPRFPDFINQKTQQSLWLNGKWLPPWVEPKLAVMTPGTVKVGCFEWNQKLTKYAKAGQHKKTMELYEQMQNEGINPNKFTFYPVLSACASLRVLEEGRRIHAQIKQNGFSSDLFLGSSLIDMYGKCGSIEEAEKLFNDMPMKGIATWNAMIQGYVKCGKGRQALKLYHHMQQEQVDPSAVTFVVVLAACASLAALEEGRNVHGEIIRRGYEAHERVRNGLIDMYGKCGSIDDAERVFNQMPTGDVVTWNSMLLGYVKCREGKKALELYHQQQQDQVKPDAVTFVAVLNACASIGALEEGRGVHEKIIQRGYEANVFLGSSLIDMYAKCGTIEDAARLFNQMLKRDVVIWNAMILGYVKCGEPQQALELYTQMQQELINPSRATFMAVLNACAIVAALERGRAVHAEIIRRGYEADDFLSSCLIDMYSKCGSIGDAERVFKHMPIRDVVAWTAMLAAYGRHGYAKEAIEHFKQMCEAVEVNAITFVCLLAACSHGGLVDDGLEYFKSMSICYNISPTMAHYTCVVDLLGRAGRLREAEDMILSMPLDPDATIWMSLLGACRAYSSEEVGERCAKRVLELEPDNSSAYVLLSDIYVATGKWDSRARVQQDRLDRGLAKTPGRSWIESKEKVHSFVIDDREHPHIMELHAELKRLSEQMKDAGYAVDGSFLVPSVDEGERQFQLCDHSVMLAIAFGLTSITPGTPLQIVENGQMCGHCHSSIKFIAKIVGGSIIVSDANRTHHFQGGLCSCRDYW